MEFKTCLFRTLQTTVGIFENLLRITSCESSLFSTLPGRFQIIQLALAILSIVFQISITSLASRYSDGFAYVAPGIWVGAFFMVSGILGVISGKRSTSCPIVAALVMTILSALAATAMLGLEIAAAVINIEATPTGLHSMQCIISFTALVVSVIQSTYCCATTPCCASHQEPQGNFKRTANLGQMLTTVMPGQPTVFGYPGQLAAVMESGQSPYVFQAVNTATTATSYVPVIAINPQQPMTAVNIISPPVHQGSSIQEKAQS
ncbi:unnamed protein product [Clavelina lepadiformis]|uniref:Uncharacterized protein n=2 Tax=Clavelina lepadiformis TaxID=159417 RepID=A0ABP0F247_CLALP